MNMTLVLLVLGMGAVTYIPRMLPMVLLQNLQLPPFLQRFFQFIPFAALGALIFPGILTSAGEDNIAAAVAGGLVCVLFAWLRLNVMIVVLAGIITVLLWQTIW
ncbi:AzlD domain-containing protein [Aneurinibacillus sp. REN35]|uniref:AzlD domain-containing protein n=1 Tax=Aneurinibacillus sp. REN35 TaxID=3237286 RepID=UPI00352763F7